MEVQIFLSLLTAYFYVQLIASQAGLASATSSTPPTFNLRTNASFPSVSPSAMNVTTQITNVTIWQNSTESTMGKPEVARKISLNDLASDKVNLAARIGLGVVFVFGTVFGIFGNILVLLAISLTGTLRQQIPNLLVCNLSITDLLISCLSMPILGIYMSIYWPKWPFAPILCKISVYVANVCATESIITLIIIAIDRYFAVIRNKVLINRRVFYILVIATWVITAGALSYPLRNSGGVVPEKLNNVTYEICQRMTGRHLINKDFRNTSILKISAGFVIIGLLVGLYIRMGIFIFGMRHTPTEENHNKSIRSRNVKQADRNKAKAVKMMFIIVILFLICWAPYWIVTFLRVFPLRKDHFVSPSIVLATYALSMLNSSWNPILYALLSNSFRKAYARILGKKKIKRFNSSYSGTMKTHVSYRASVISNTAVTKAAATPTFSLNTVKE